MKALWNGVVIAESQKTIVMERNHYFPPDDVKMEYLRKSSKVYTCPWKGDAVYYDVSVHGKTSSFAAWSYQDPKDAAGSLRMRIAFAEGVEVVS